MKKFITAYNIICFYFCKALEYAAFILLGAMVVIMFLQIVLRALFNSSLVWGEEMLRYLFIIDTFLCSSVCLYHSDLSRFELISNKLSFKQNRLLLTFIDLFIIALLLITGIGSFKLVSRQMAQLGTSVKIPMGYIYSIIPISCFTGAFFLANKIIRSWFMPEKEAE